jgi:serine O-acetyltransferase
VHAREITDVRSAVMADVVRYCGRASIPLLMRTVLRERTFRPVLALRLCQAAAGSRRGRVLLPVLMVLHRIATARAAVDLPWRTPIGPGFRLFHGWAAVVNPAARIGANVSLFHGVTLGQGDRIDVDGTRATGYPVIEDEVWIGPGAAVLGGVRVGRGSRIAAGTVVIRDVEPGCMVAGNPASVVRADVPADVLNPAAVGPPAG